MLGSQKTRVVVVDDEQYICNIIEESLDDEAYDVVTFSDPVRALEHIECHPVDLVLTDLVMGDHSGVQVLEAAKEHHEDIVVILMTAHPTVETAISVLKRGAYDFLVKPFKLELLKASIRRGLAHQKVIRENIHLRGQVEFLKAATTMTPQQNLDEYLTVVLESCITETEAVAAAMIGVSPATKEVIREVCIADRDDVRQELLNRRTLTTFIEGPSRAPVITTRPGAAGDPVSLITISLPVFIGSKCHGVINILIESRFERVTPGTMNALKILVNSAASAINNEQLYTNLQESYLQAIRALANAIEARDPYTAGHTDRVIKLAEALARELGWDDKRINILIMGCTLHDIGKIGIPDAILNKPTGLSDEERARMVRHPKQGLKIIRGIELFEPSIPYIIAHHERYDGKGYPKGLKGKDIPIEGRLLAVVDTFDAIMSDRPYRKGAPIMVAINELVENKGTQFDPELVDTFIGMLKRNVIDLPALYGREIDLSDLQSVRSEMARV